MQLQKVICAPDSFKGTLSASEISLRMKEAILQRFPSCNCIALPVADGGEGTAECLLTACGGERICCQVQGPLGEPISAEYVMLSSGDTAVIELAAAAGLPLVGNRKDPSRTTTYGVGELCRDALQKGAKRLFLTLGGSCTNDGGTGIAAALGTRFYRADGTPFLPTGGTLREIASIDTTASDRLLEGVEVTVLCDVDNPLCGERGASAVYAPQKGADPAMVAELDAGLSHLADRLEDIGRPVRTLPGGGAAGGTGAGAVAFLHGTLRSGIETILELLRFDEELKDTDLVFTGEGRFDGQSLSGKVVSGIASHAQKQNVPVIAVVGDIGDPIDEAYTAGVTAVFSTNRIAAPYEQIRHRAGEDISRTMDSILRLLALS